MSTSPNIFERLATTNQSDNFSNISAIPEQDMESGNIFEKLAQQEEQNKNNKFGFLETARDIGEQVATKGLSGVGGAYGNILDTLGLQTKEGEILPGQQNVQDIQSKILDKINRGETPTFEELNFLSEDQTVPTYARLPSSKQLQQGIQDLTGIGEGKTAPGRIAGRAAEFIGEGVGLGPGASAKTLGSLGLAGASGQGIREAGGPEGLATGIEIGGSLLPSALQGKVIPTSKGGKDIANAGRRVGLSEKQISPLIQGETKSLVLSKVARKGTKTRELFSSIKNDLGNSYQSIKNSVSNLGNVNAANRRILIDKFTDISQDLQKTLKASPDKEAAIKFIEGAISNVSKNGASPEELINFWQDINKSVKWNSIQGGRKSLTRLKEPILEVLNNVAPTAAKDFELTNQLYSKYAQIAKKLKPDIVDSFVNKGEILAGAPAALSLLSGNVLPLASLGGEIATRLLAREMLINPYFQNIANKLVKNFNQGSAKAVTETVKQVQDYMKRKHPDEKWDFLTESD